DPLPRLLSAAGLAVSLLALLFSMGALAPAASRRHHHHGAQVAARLKNRCPVSNAVRLGSWCLESTPHPVPAADAGQNDYLYAAQTCVREGGWLPSAAQLIGAAPKAALNSTIDDNPGTANVTEFPNAEEGIKDRREMSADLTTTQSGDRAAGSEGVS